MARLGRDAAVLIAAVVSTGCSPQTSGTPIQMFAAASATEAISELRDAFENETGFEVELTLSSSSSLAVQVQSGAEADLFLSANRAWADEVVWNDRGRSRVLDRIDLMSNRLVVVASPEAQLKLASLSGLSREEFGEIAIAEPTSVPAGIYAREALEQAGVWEALEDRMIPGTNVRTVLGYVESGVVPIGIVYASDAVASPDVKVLLEIDPEAHSAIRYPLLLLRHSRKTPGAEEFYDYLTSPSAATVFERHGFSAVSDAEGQ
jgi:molybdate transport system substrate-binding protein